MQSSSARKTFEDSSGRRPKPSDASAAPLEEQPTVISSRSPLPAESAEAATVYGPGRVGPGTRLGPYELLECVGGGGMGRVFRALDTNLDRIVAVKVLSREQAADAETLLRFRNEAQSAARLNHENIVQVYHVGEEDGLPYIVFEFIEGQNLRTLVDQGGGLKLGDAIRYTLQVAQALAHAAQRNVVHRDIKPSNVLITADGRVKLIDLGLARVQRGDPAGDLTASGVTLGTFDYISPEQARDPRTADVRSDIYSLGCTLFYMLAGRPPFPEGTVLQKLLQHQGEEPPDVRRFRPDLPEEASRLVRRMMAKDPRRRFQSAAELTAALLHLAEQQGLHPLGLAQAWWAEGDAARGLSPFQRHLPWMAPVVVLLAIVVVLDLVWSSPQGGLPAARPVVAQSDEAGDTREDNGLAGVDEPWLPDDETPGAVDAGTTQGASPGATATSPGAEPSPAGNSAPPKPSAATAAKVPATTESPGKEPAPAKTKETAGSANPPGATGDSGATAGTAVPGLPGGSVPTSRSPETTPAPKPSGSPEPARPSSPGVFVVDGVGGSENRFATLGAACAKAASGHVIVLEYSGRREERPIALNNLRLTIRAGEGFRPVVVFRPSEPDPAQYPRAMFLLSGSQLTLVNLAIDMEVPRELLSDPWSLFEVRRSESVRLEKCWLTIRNASDDHAAFHQDVAFFRTKSDPGMGNPILAGDERPLPPTAISLADCVVRGEAVVLRTHDLRPLQFSWDNGLLATTERLLLSDGGDKSPAPGDAVRLDLNHVTAAVRGGLCRMEQNDLSPHQLPLSVRCASSILVGTASGPLLEQAGVVGKEPFESRVSWNGERNFYEGFTVFWNVVRGDAEIRPAPKTFDAWWAYWGPDREILPAMHRVQWKKPLPAASPVHAHTPADYALGRPSEGGAVNPAVGAASDGKDAGMIPERLPPSPPDEQAAVKAESVPTEASKGDSQAERGAQ
ncbi:MAG: protein kinase [Thermoguttaceae bacterium]|nr:protein kinase [Thermoguttaceae bacterium]